MRPSLSVLLVLVTACASPAARPSTGGVTGPPSSPTPGPPATVQHTSPASAQPAAGGAPNRWIELARRLEAPDAGALTSRLVDAERRLRDEGVPASDVAALTRVQQAAYRQLVATPAWIDRVVPDVPEELRRGVQSNLDAAIDLRALTSPRPALPPWRIVAPLPVDELAAHYRAAQDRFGIHWTYLAAIHLVETRMGRIRGTSTAGARGPMQFMPSTWDRYGEGDIEDARDSIFAAARYLAASGGPRDMDNALYAYNHSRRYVRAVGLYAGEMAADDLAYRAYHGWQVYYRTTAGDALLEEGYAG